MKRFELKNWHFQSDIEREHFIVKGNVYNNPKFYDGQNINTSCVKEIVLKNNVLEVYTLNSIYECALEEHKTDVSDLEKEIIKEMTEPFVDMENLKERICVLIEEKRKKEEELLKNLVPEELDEVLIFNFASDTEYYIKSIFMKRAGVCKYSEEYGVHVGTFQDSVFIDRFREKDDFDGENELDFRFFPYAGNRLEFYSWYGFDGEIYAKNSGKEEIEVDTPAGKFLIPPEKCYPLMPHSLIGRIQKSIVPAIDKYCIWDAQVDEKGLVSYQSPKEEQIKNLEE